MADFDFTYKSWDKIRPLTLKKTGLGEALKSYENGLKALSGSGSDLVKRYINARKRIDDADSARKKAIDACGNNSLYQSARKALQNASPKPQVARLAAVFAKELSGHLTKVEQVADEMDSRQLETIKLIEATIKLTKAGKKVPSAAIHRTIGVFRGGDVFSGIDTTALELVSEVASNASALSDVNSTLVSTCKQQMVKIAKIRKRSGVIKDLAYEAKDLLGMK